MAEPILDLDTLIERKPVRIDGQLYELLNPGELNILDLHRFGTWGKALDDLKNAVGSGSFTDEQLGAISEALGKMVRLILRAPEEVQAKLTDVHRFRIISAFNLLTLPKQPAASVSEPSAADPAAPDQTPPPTGEKS